MKNLRLRLLTVATLALISAAACKKDSDGSSAGLSATISGTNFQPSVVTAMDLQGSITIGGFQIQSGDTLTMALYIPDTAHVNNSISFKVATITYTKAKAAYYTYGNSLSHGSITLSTLDKTAKKIAGNFSGTVYSAISTNDSIVITNGQFNTTYQ